MDQQEKTRQQELDGFASRLAEAMSTLGVKNPERLSVAIGIGKTRAYKWADGKALPDFEGLQLLARWSGMSADWWLGLDESPTSESAISEESVAALEDYVATRPKGRQLRPRKGRRRKTAEPKTPSAPED